MSLEKLNERFQSVKDELNKLSNNVLSKEEREKQLQIIKDNASQLKVQLEKELNNLHDASKEDKEAFLKSLSEITNFELSLKCNNYNTKLSAGKEEGPLVKAKNWIVEQWTAIWDEEKRGKEKEQNILRSIGFGVTGIGTVALLCKGIANLFGKRKNKKTETDDSGSNEKSFWERPFGKFLKWTGIGTAAYYVSHGIKTGKRNVGEAFNWKKDTDTNSAENGQNNSSENNNSPEAEAPAENTEGNSSGNENDSGNENVETFEAISTDSFSSAALKTLKDVVTLDEDTINNIKTTLNNYLQTNPILKKSANGHMKFEIGNKTKFNNTLKQVWNDALSGLNRVKRGVAKTLFDGKLDNIDKTMRELKAKEYENVVFKYLGGIVKETVKAENGNMTVQEFYDSIKRYYPNKNASTIERAILNSGQANKDIKDMDVEEIKNA